ncbi:MAG TPA: hypothetical protein PKL31_08955 [Fulvivirga sp.]|nr:hypothetical protein [Fulvivirga sp.]
MDKSPKEIFRLTSLIHAFLAVPITVIGLLIYYNIVSNPAPLEDDPLFLYIPIGIMMVAILGARPIYNKIIASQLQSSFIVRMNAFLRATIIRDALFEAAGMAACVFAYLTGNNTLLLLIAIIVLQFFINRPSKQKIENDLRATKEELKELD